MTARPFSSWLALLSVVVSALGAGCNANVKIDPEGYQCDPVGVCPMGYSCIGGACTRTATTDGGTGKCAGVTCTMPPASTCNGSTLHSFVGRCDANTGGCVYDPMDTVCSGGCTNGACANLCQGVACTTPPDATCNGKQLTVYSQTGTCTPATGKCEYTPTTNTCALSCDAANKRCVNQDLCMNVSCNTPPAAMCVGSTARSFSATGTCDSGTGACTYAPVDTACGTSPCVSGACVGPALTFTRIGPRVTFAVNALDTTTSSTGENVLVVGNGGKVAQWDGSTWTTLTTPNTNDLNAVNFVSPTTAFIVGKSRTVYTVRSATVTAQGGVPGSGSANLVAVYGRDSSNVLVVDEGGNWLRSNGTSWTNGSFPNANTPYSMRSVFIDETGRERVGGTCASSNGAARLSCIAYRNPNGSTPTQWFIDTDTDSSGITAVGPWVEPGSGSNPPDTLAGKNDLSNTLVRHTSGGNFNPSNVSLAEGDGVRGIATGVGSTGNRLTWVLTSSAGTSKQGALYSLSKSGGSVSATQQALTFFGEEHLSLNDAAGVVFADTNRMAGVNNIIRRSLTTTTALDLGEDFAAVTADSAGNTFYAVTSSGDVATKRGTSATYEFVRGAFVDVQAAEARNGATLLFVGKNGAGNGSLNRGAGTPTAVQEFGSVNGVVFKAVCRVSDAEAYAVGTGGAIYRIDSTVPAAVRMTSPTTRDLYSVDCTTGAAVACGDNGTVLRLVAGAWTAATPAFPVANRLESCRLINGTVYAAGDNVFAKSGTTAWTQLAARAGLKHLVAKGPTEIYATTTATSANNIVRFDGTTWVTLLQVPDVLGGGVQISGRVVYGGTNGALFEGR